MDQASTDMMSRAVGPHSIAYRKHGGAQPTVVFLPGYGSDMEGAKAQAVDVFASHHGLGMLRFDYSGTGSSSGQFEDGTLDLWLAEAMEMIAALTEGPIVLVGSSMGGWLALHIALRLPDRVRAIVGIAAAPDFTDWGFDKAQRALLAERGHLGTPGDDRKFTHGFWKSGQQLLLLGSPIAVDCAVRLIHGSDDRDVPVAIAQRLLDRLHSADVQLTIVKGGGHRLSAPHEIETILRALGEMVQYVESSP